MAELKTKPTDASVRDYLEAITPEQRQRDGVAVCELMRRATGCRPRIWGSSIVGFGRYHYTYRSGKSGSHFLTGLSSRKRSLTVYIMPGFAPFQDLMTRLGRYTMGKSCLYLATLGGVEPLLLEELIVRSVAVMSETHRTDDGS